MTIFHVHRETIGWTIQRTANECGVNERTVRRWDSGEYQAPASVSAWLADLAGYHQRHPCPK